MANFYEVFTRFTKPYQIPLMILLALCIFGVVAYFGYVRFYQNDKGALKAHSDVANNEGRGKPIQIYFFYVDWCPHCKTAKPAWQSFKDEYDKKTVNGQYVECIDFNCTDEDNSSDIRNKLLEFNVKGFPHVVLVSDETRIEFDAKITKSSLEQFVQAAASQ